MKKILFLVMSLFFLFSCSNEYKTFHEENNKKIESEKYIKQQVSNFSFEDVKYLSGITLTQTPDTKYLDEIAKKVENAKNRVYLEVYILTETRLQTALKKAHKNWVEVKVLLEKNVYKAPSLNKKSYENLSKSWIDVKYSNPDNYALNHTKMLFIDDEVILSTWNYSYSSFKYNKEFFLNIKNKEINEYFLNIFNADFAWEKLNTYHPNLVLSPFYTREKLDYIIKNAKKEIKIYANNIWDVKILNLLKEAREKGIIVDIIIPSLEKVSSNKDEVEFFKINNINFKHTTWKIQNHAKSILVDDKILYIWSINFSTASIERNREIWILLINEDLIKKFKIFFDKDFK